MAPVYRHAIGRRQAADPDELRARLLRLLAGPPVTCAALARHLGYAGCHPPLLRDTLRGLVAAGLAEHGPGGYRLARPADAAP